MSVALTYYNVVYEGMGILVVATSSGRIYAKNTLSTYYLFFRFLQNVIILFHEFYFIFDIIKI